MKLSGTTRVEKKIKRKFSGGVVEYMHISVEHRHISKYIKYIEVLIYRFENMKFVVHTCGTM